MPRGARSQDPSELRLRLSPETYGDGGDTEPRLEDVLRSLEEIRANLSPFQCFLSSKCVRAIRSGERIQEIEGRILSQRTVDTFRNLSMLTRMRQELMREQESLIMSLKSISASSKSLKSLPVERMSQIRRNFQFFVGLPEDQRHSREFLVEEGNLSPSLGIETMARKSSS